jgi:hypothetical protein
LAGWKGPLELQGEEKHHVPLNRLCPDRDTVLFAPSACVLEERAVTQVSEPSNSS